MTRIKPMARICWWEISTVCSRVYIVTVHTKDKTIIVMTPAMVAVGCAEVGGMVDGR